MKKKLVRLWRLLLWNLLFKRHYRTAILKLEPLFSYPLIVSFFLTDEWKDKFLELAMEKHENS